MFAALVICRLMHYSAAMALFGASIFAWTLAPPRLAAMLNQSAWRLAVAATWIMIVTALCWLVLEAGMIGDGWPDVFHPATIGAVLFGTEFGQAWQVHCILILALLAVIAKRRPSLTVTASALAVASLGLIGHAAVQSGAIGWLHRTNLALHLAAGGFWIGGLVPLLSTLRLVGEPLLVAMRSSLCGASRCSVMRRSRS
jgi:copper resistance protein D